MPQQELGDAKKSPPTKHIILLFDGTWNSAATGRYRDITNIFRLNIAIKDFDRAGIPQIVFYIPGPGNRGLFDQELGGIFGQGIDQIVREAYVNLSSNYCNGDTVYIFGYSRGAIAARALSCILAEAGLLKTKHLHKLAEVWQHFVDINRSAKERISKDEVRNYVHEITPSIQFMGLFDSVLGRDYRIPTRFSELVFANNTVSPLVRNGVHLLAIDDNRRIFAPMLWGARNGDQHIEQIWVPGVHADIGGAGPPSFISTACLLTMIDRIESKTPLYLEEAFIEDRCERLKHLDDIRISNERKSALMKALRYRDRSPGSSSGDEQVHYLLGKLLDRQFLIRGKKKVYSANRLKPFLQLRPSTDKFEQHVLDLAEEALGRG
jgi:uncharacterized protein (DUF2235 family)